MPLPMLINSNNAQQFPDMFFLQRKRGVFLPQASLGVISVEASSLQELFLQITKNKKYDNAHLKSWINFFAF